MTLVCVHRCFWALLTVARERHTGGFPYQQALGSQTTPRDLGGENGRIPSSPVYVWHGFLREATRRLFRWLWCSGGIILKGLQYWGGGGLGGVGDHMGARTMRLKGHTMRRSMASLLDPSGAKIFPPSHRSITLNLLKCDVQNVIVRLSSSRLAGFLPHFPT